MLIHIEISFAVKAAYLALAAHIVLKLGIMVLALAANTANSVSYSHS